MSTEAQAALSRLSDDELQRLILELGRYALSVSSKLYWRTGDARELPRGETVESIVSLALTKVLSGERRWNPVQAPDFKTYVMDVIDSLLYHLATSKDNTLLTSTSRRQNDDTTQPELAPPDPASSPVWHAQLPENPEHELLRLEDAEHNAYALRLLQAAVDDDPLLAQMVQAMRDGHGKPGEIAQVMGIAVTDVYNAMKRLDRKIVKVRAQVMDRTA